MVEGNGTRKINLIFLMLNLSSQENPRKTLMDINGSFLETDSSKKLA